MSELLLECRGGPLDGEHWDLDGKAMLLVAHDATLQHVDSPNVRAAALNAFPQANAPMRRAATGYYARSNWTTGAPCCLRWYPFTKELP